MRLTRYLRQTSSFLPVQDKYLKVFNEAFNQRKVAAGVVKFSKSSLGDPKYAPVLTWLAKETGVSVSEIVMQIQEKINKLKFAKNKAPILYHTVVDNAAEDRLFTRFWETPGEVPGSPRFSPRLFNDLVKEIRFKDHPELFMTMRGFIKSLPLKKPNILVVQDERNPEADENAGKAYSKVRTACATGSGSFVFNAKFMQVLS